MAGTRAYLTTAHRLAANQEAAGKGFTKVEVPYGKQEQLDFINGLLDAERALALPMEHEPVDLGHFNCGGSYVGGPTVKSEAKRPAFLGPEPEPSPACPRCKYPGDQALARVRSSEQSVRLTAIEDIVWEADERFLETLQETIDARRKELA